MIPAQHLQRRTTTFDRLFISPASILVAFVCAQAGDSFSSDCGALSTSLKANRLVSQFRLVSVLEPFDSLADVLMYDPYEQVPHGHFCPFHPRHDRSLLVFCAGCLCKNGIEFYDEPPAVGQCATHSFAFLIIAALAYPV